MLYKFLLGLLMVCAALVPAAYLYHVYPLLPETIPTHFNLSGTADRFGQKQNLIFTTALLSAVTLLSFVVIRYLPKIDPKKTAKLSASAFHKMAIAMVIFLSAINTILIHATLAGDFNFSKLFNPLLGFFFIYVGNLMYNLKPNYFLGIRVPWTLENPDNWRATHRMGSILWVIGGLIILIGGLVLKPAIGEIVFLAVLTVIVLVPILYSFIYFRKQQQAS